MPGKSGGHDNSGVYCITMRVCLLTVSSRFFMSLHTDLSLRKYTQLKKTRFKKPKSQKLKPQNSFFDYLGALLGVGYMVSGYGTVVGHDLAHRTRDKISLIEARWLLSASCNADFAIEHVYGHHVTVCTNDDPATARRGENVYAFSIRSTVMGHISAWKHELKKLRKKI